jgi:phenylpropionate dioxygenase-like ring-hydroxylating dioxygenase large terminal subunit
MSPLLVETQGNIRDKIICPYHMWSYGLDGKLSNAPYMPEDFKTEQVCLPQFSIEIWEGWIYVSLSQNPVPLAPRLAKLSERLKNYRVSEFLTLFHVDEVWNTNWKVLYENFSESYHVFSLHKTTIDGAQPTRLTNCSFDNEPGFYYYEQGRQLGSKVVYPGNLVISNTDLNEHQRKHNPMICVYPAHAFAVAAERMFWMSLQPEGVGKVRVRWGIDIFPGAVPPDWDFEAFRDDMRRISEDVNREDRWMIETMYQNAGSAFVETNRISPLERTTWELQRYLISRIDGDLKLARQIAS